MLSISLWGYFAPHAVVLGVDWNTISTTSHDVILATPSHNHSIHQILIICLQTCWIRCFFLVLLMARILNRKIHPILYTNGFKRLLWEQIVRPWFTFIWSFESFESTASLLWCNLPSMLQINILSFFGLSLFFQSLLPLQAHNVSHWKIDCTNTSIHSHSRPCFNALHSIRSRNMGSCTSRGILLGHLWCCNIKGSPHYIVSQHLPTKILSSIRV